MRDPAMRPSFPHLLQQFFVEYLGQQKAVSRHTVAAYRDTFQLLLRFAQKTIGKSPLIAGKSPKGTPVDTRDISKDICHAIEFNDDSFEHLFKNMKEGL